MVQAQARAYPSRDNRLGQPQSLIFVGGGGGMRRNTALELHETVSLPHSWESLRGSWV